jgi:hypothetical protein
MTTDTYDIYPLPITSNILLDTQCSPHLYGLWHGQWTAGRSELELKVGDYLLVGWTGVDIYVGAYKNWNYGLWIYPQSIHPDSYVALLDLLSPWTAKELPDREVMCAWLTELKLRRIDV